jgi:hypothetical protein
VKIKNISKYGVAAYFLCMSQFSNAGFLNIEINNLGGLSTSQASTFHEATNFWESILTGIQSELDLTLTIGAEGVIIDGVSGILGQAGPTTIGSNNGFTFAVTGIMQFDSADLAALETNDKLFDVILHEMAHVLGFGALWNTDSIGGSFAGTQNVYTKGSGEYTGAYALAEYRKEFDPSALFVPVDIVGGPGTANGHWAEDWAGGRTDLMTGILDSNITLSRTTIASFADIGYTTFITHPVSAPPAIAMFLIGLAFALRRKKR